MKNRVAVESVFKSFPFYFGGALGAALFQDNEATDFAIAGARSLAAMYNPALKLIPLGAQAEEALGCRWLLAAQHVCQGVTQLLMSGEKSVRSAQVITEYPVVPTLGCFTSGNAAR